MIESCLSAITPDSLIGFLAELKRQGASPKTQNEYWNAARGFCNWCVRTRRLAGNPLSIVAKTEHTEQTFRRRALTVEKADRLLKAAGPRRLVYLAALRTGLRRNELRTLQWGDLHMDPQERKPRITLRASVTKARRADTIPLRKDILRELRAVKPADAGPTDKVFRAIPEGRTLDKDLQAAGIPKVDAAGRIVDFHALRHTLGTWLAKAGTAPREHMELMRHSSMAMTQRFYVDPHLLSLSEAMADLPDLDTDAEPNVMVRTGTDDLPVDDTASEKVASSLFTVDRLPAHRARRFGRRGRSRAVWASLIHTNDSCARCYVIQRLQFELSPVCRKAPKRKMPGGLGDCSPKSTHTKQRGARKYCAESATRLAARGRERPQRHLRSVQKPLKTRGFHWPGRDLNPHAPKGKGF